ncbi:FadR/GntR family transcriptional regulator [Oryzicola mucosus]|uniref:FadR family transcriptional regulator n=1 Tax=Oryzicola mucosus TaxID=2767425 RepID=A0A8J6TXM7_9HYPH|nr:FadR/GntR family transcriptional regulator [Oryzicola mucosus]MBD0413454.1 FadR family transcriptional regulator [Oryzicola mucosus]
MSLNYDEVVRTGLAKQVADNIRAAILEGRLKVDERLPNEEELARRFGISRPTVREALKRLAAQNLIRSRRGPTGGNFVTRPDPEGLSKAITGAATLLVGIGAFDIDEIVTARMETECICARLAAANRTDADIAAMEAEVEFQLREEMTDEEFCASDVRFHRALVDAAGNGPLKLMMYTVIEAFIPITNMVTYRYRERREASEWHRRIVDAIRAHDVETAGGLLREHILGMRDTFMLALERRAQDAEAAGPL